MNFIKVVILLVLTLVIASSPQTISSVKGNNLSRVVSVDTSILIPLGDTGIVSDVSDDTLYTTIIEHIKQFEKFKESIYIDTDGSPTIGYGHHLKRGEVFNEIITEKEATQILIDDFNKRVNLVETNYDLIGSKAYAIALFIYNCGSGTYAKSSLKRAVENEDPIDTIIIKYCKYKKDGVYHFSSGLLERRKFELEIYKSC